ncbi:hypothetical protein Prubr_62600 [Polymorphospora rubra]|uniref:Uncharacterized protein n=1 Tax=Polymorphospora rubra TaxID=338584 RepID=A0A810NAW3_9ACTN|nr:hypothetical protein Prubr_62600 [Polymorphospora rubra]
MSTSIHRDSSAWHCASAASNTGQAPIRPAAIPADWAPWPGKTHTGPAPGSGTLPVTTVAAGAPAASASSPASRSSRSAPITPARCSNTDRVVASDHATRAGSTAGCSRTYLASRAACAARAGPDRADSGHSVTGEVSRPVVVPGTTSCPAAAEGSAGAACSRMTWALVPEMPNEETAARRGRSRSGQGRARVSRDTAPEDQAMCGDGSSTCRVAGSTPCRIACTILITPAMPAADWLWPMLDLIEPSQSGSSAGRSWPYVASSACASIGSPSVVPVPCASTTSTSAPVSRALPSACRITRCCAGPFGAVRPLDAPSWLIALPRTTARTRWPWRRASDSRSTSSRPTPSAQPVPSAPAAKDLQRPSEDRPRWREKPTKALGVAITVTPPASARSNSPCRSA